jgi:carbon-monoxide dehydrogenase large subunit
VSILGNRVQRVEDPELLTGAGRYVDDVTLPAGAAHVVYVRSPLAFARIESIDVDDAGTAPGVLAVVTASDLSLGDLDPEMMFLNQDMKRPVLARDVVRFAGEPVAAVVAETRTQASTPPSWCSSTTSRSRPWSTPSRLASTARSCSPTPPRPWPWRSPPI